MGKKFELTSETISHFGLRLYRIRALVSFGSVLAGENGGFVEKEENLSNDGDAWVYGNALVYGNARVSGNAWVSGNARVYGNARVSGDALVSGNALVSGDAWVSGDAEASKTPIVLCGLKFTITVSDKHLSAGCEIATFEEWRGRRGEEIAENHNEHDFLKTIRGLLDLLGK